MAYKYMKKQDIVNEFTMVCEMMGVDEDTVCFSLHDIKVQLGLTEDFHGMYLSDLQNRGDEA